MAVFGQIAFTAMPASLNSSAMPRTHMDIPYLAIVYATWFLNQMGLIERGGELFSMCGFLPLVADSL